MSIDLKAIGVPKWQRIIAGISIPHIVAIGIVLIGRVTESGPPTIWRAIAVMDLLAVVVVAVLLCIWWIAGKPELP